jgi:hypothetical protein
MLTSIAQVRAAKSRNTSALPGAETEVSKTNPGSDADDFGAKFDLSKILPKSVFHLCFICG